jgi:hypothetical protein
MTRYISACAVMSGALALGGCWQYGTYEYHQAQYLHRTDTITMTAGNDQEINEATQVIDPWPKSAGNRRIPGHGERMVNAAERYRARQSGSGGGNGNGGQPGQPGAPQGGGADASQRQGSNGTSSP